MIKIILSCLLTLTLGAFAAEPAAPKESATGPVCAVDGRPLKAGLTTVYEERTYSFCSEKCKTAFVTRVQASIYHQIGGKAAMDAAIEIFYKKVLADTRIKHFFEDINMNAQRRKQKAFLSAAFGSPVKWEGRDLRRAHANLPGLNDSHFDAVAENLKATLEELNVKPELVGQIMALAGSLRNDVLNRKPAAQ